MCRTRPTSTSNPSRNRARRRPAVAVGLPLRSAFGLGRPAARGPTGGGPGALAAASPSAAPARRSPSRSAAARYLPPVLLVLLGCVTSAPDTGVGDVPSTPPTITDITLGCAGESGKWTIDVVTDAWSGGGSLYLSRDGAYVEEHPIYSVESAVDGTMDHLKATLALAADVQDVHEGSSTAFNCGTPDLEGLFVLRDRAGSQITDCRDFGPDPSSWTTWGIGECTETVAVEPL